MGSSASLLSVRRRIDRLDAQLLRLVNRRAAFALLIGRIKRRRKWPVFDAPREAFVLRHITRANRGPLSARAVARVFQAVLRECRRRERTSKKRR
ncbi:MAG: chorismate mutase, type II [Alphaproteobacteria bacterium]|nr:MAG: chorismate mutase, type II [Alphaproteobacteria bacterium]